MLKLNLKFNDASFCFSHLKNLSMLKYIDYSESNPQSFSHLKNLSMLKYETRTNRYAQCFSHLKNLSMLK